MPTIPVLTNWRQRCLPPRGRRSRFPATREQFSARFDAIVLDHTYELANDDHASAQVRGVASLKLDEIEKMDCDTNAVGERRGSRAELFFCRKPNRALSKEPRRTPFANARCAPGRRPDSAGDDWE